MTELSRGQKTSTVATSTAIPSTPAAAPVKLIETEVGAKDPSEIVHTASGDITWGEMHQLRHGLKAGEGVTSAAIEALIAERGPLKAEDDGSTTPTDGGSTTITPVDDGEGKSYYEKGSGEHTPGWHQEAERRRESLGISSDSKILEISPTGSVVVEIEGKLYKYIATGTHTGEWKRVEIDSRGRTIAESTPFSSDEAKLVGVEESTPEERFEIGVKRGDIPKGSLYIDKDQYLPPESVESIKTNSPELYKILIEKGFSEYQKAYKAETEAVISALPSGLQRVYYEEGIDALNDAIASYNRMQESLAKKRKTEDAKLREKTQAAEAVLSPYKSATGGYKLADILVSKDPEAIEAAHVLFTDKQIADTNKWIENVWGPHALWLTLPGSKQVKIPGSEKIVEIKRRVTPFEEERGETFLGQLADWRVTQYAGEKLRGITSQKEKIAPAALVAIVAPEPVSSVTGGIILGGMVLAGILSKGIESIQEYKKVTPANVEALNIKATETAFVTENLGKFGRIPGYPYRTFKPLTTSIPDVGYIDPTGTFVHENLEELVRIPGSGEEKKEISRWVEKILNPIRGHDISDTKSKMDNVMVAVSEELVLERPLSPNLQKQLDAIVSGGMSPAVMRQLDKIVKEGKAGIIHGKRRSVAEAEYLRKKALLEEAWHSYVASLFPSPLGKGLSTETKNAIATTILAKVYHFPIPDIVIKNSNTLVEYLSEVALGASKAGVEAFNQSMSQKATETDALNAAKTASDTYLQTLTETQSKTAAQSLTETQVKTATRTLADTRTLTDAQALAATQALDATQTKAGTGLPPKLPFPLLSKGRKGVVKKSYPVGSVVWKQGAWWKIIPPPYNKLKPLSSREAPVGVIALTGTPQETLTFVGGKFPATNISFDLGVTDGFIDVKKKQIVFSGSGLKTNVGERMDDPAKGMSIPGIDRPSMGEFYPAQSVSRQDLGKKARPRKGQKAESATQGISRPKITEDTKKMAETDDMGAFIDETDEWERQVDLGWGKKKDNKAPKKKSKKRVGLSKRKDNPKNTPTTIRRIGL